MTFQELAEKRYSCRKFTEKKVEKELVEKIIKAGMAAPTAVNKQPYKIFWMESEQAKENIKKVTRFTFGADTFLLVVADENEGWVRKYDERKFADVDASIVATHMMLAIEDLGLATTWVGYFDAPLLKDLCPELKDYDLLAIFPIGYAAEDGGEPSERHYQRKEWDEVVKML